MTNSSHQFRCDVCQKDVNIEEVKYHTKQEENKPMYIFCGPECSLKYHQKEKQT